MFALIRTGLVVAFCLFSSQIFAQDRICYDRIPKKITTDGGGNGVYYFTLKWTMTAINPSGLVKDDLILIMIKKSNLWFGFFVD